MTDSAPGPAHRGRGVARRAAYAFGTLCLHRHVLHHALGYFKKTLDAHDRHELLDLIEQYRTSLVPLVVPITLLRHHVRRLEVAYLSGQTYLEPHPRELMLRNHV